MLLSIIIPVYNAEKYLSECLESIKKCPIAEMECIVINDGSTDTSLEIANSFSKEDTRIKIFTISNGGVSNARNQGILKSSGDYIMFLDADDYLSSESFDLFWENIQENIDFYTYSYYTLEEDGSAHPELFHLDLPLADSIDNIYPYLLATPLLNTCWGKLFKRNIIFEHNLSFPLEMKTGEDAVFVLHYLYYCKNATIIDQAILYYRQHSESAMRTINIDKKMSDLELLFKERKKFIEEKQLQLLYPQFYRHFFSVLTNLLLEMTSYYSGNDLIKTFKLILTNSISDEIISSVQVKYISPSFKKIEFVFMKYHSYHLLKTYFSLKKRFLN